MAGKAQKFLVNVKEKEKIKVGNKDFETFKVELFSFDDNEVKQIIWYEIQNNVMVKAQVKLPPQAGSGYITYELVD